MIALALIASHMVGDFIFQTRWQAKGKLVLWPYRLRHVLGYTLAFVPVAVLVPVLDNVPWWRSAVFLTALAGLHYLTDSNRFLSTLGDVLAFRSYWARHWREVTETGPCRTCGASPGKIECREGSPFRKACPAFGAKPLRPPLMPNPWEPIPILIDQALHFVQIAALGWLLVS